MAYSEQKEGPRQTLPYNPGVRQTPKKGLRLHCIPFEDLTVMFWNMASAASDPSINSGLPEYTPLTGNTEDFEKRDQMRPFIDAKAGDQSTRSHEFIPALLTI
jgi:hypothetical protein